MTMRLLKDWLGILNKPDSHLKKAVQNAPLKSCLEMLPQDLHEQYKASDYQIGYYGTLKSDEKASRLEPEEMPSTAEALLRLRFNYLDGDARRQVLASTAYPKIPMPTWVIWIIKITHGA